MDWELALEKRLKMNEASYEAAAALVPKTYVSQGRDARRNHEKHIQTLLQQVIAASPHKHCLIFSLITAKVAQ